jgi:hypothetical protein
MAEDERETLGGAPSGEPGPGEQTFGSDRNMVSLGGNGVQQGLGTGLHRAVQEHLAAVVKDTDRHRPGVPIDAAVIARLFTVEAPEVSSVFASFSPTPADHGGLPRRGPQ